MTDPRVLVVINDSKPAPPRLLSWLSETAVTAVVVHGEDGLPELTGFAGLILLGGGFMPDDDQRAPWLPAERALAAQAIAADLPTLGICLGGQLLALVAGGQVAAAHGIPERGMTRIRTTDEGARDRLLATVAPQAEVMENHQDAITALPSEAMLLAGSAGCPIQAFRLGEHVRGLQFHPESGVENIEAWDVDKLSGGGFVRDELIAQARAVEADSTPRCRALIKSFVDEVISRAGGPIR